MRAKKLWSLSLAAWRLKLAAWRLNLGIFYLSLGLEAYRIGRMQVFWLDACSLGLVAILHTPLVVKFFYKFGFSVSDM